VSFQNVRWDLEKEGVRLITFIFRTIIDKYLSRKKGNVYWLFVDLHKSF
jgi:hypothetical protein